MNKKGIIAIVILVLIIIAALWWRIYQTATAPSAPASAPVTEQTQPTAATAQNTAPQQPQPGPIVYAVPKLAGHVLIGPKVKTKFYLARDGKRYVFPDDTKTFDTWFPQGTALITHVSEDELESYPLGGNVCYRPGTRLIANQGDARVFAVVHGCRLRPITQDAAALLFGADWQKLVDQLQDYYFTNYTVDNTPIASIVDYNPVNERGISVSIEADKGIQ